MKSNENWKFLAEPTLGIISLSLQLSPFSLIYLYHFPYFPFILCYLIFFLLLCLLVTKLDPFRPHYPIHL
jgi:tellurite resistance protein TehA-like permease